MSPERPLGVAVLTGFVGLASLVAAVYALAMMGASVVWGLQGDAKASVTDIWAMSIGGVALLVAAGLLGWLAAANLAGRTWAWTAVSAGAMVLSGLLSLVVLALVLTAILSPKDNVAWAWGAFGFAVPAAGLLLLPRFYRRSDVREFFGKAKR